MVSEVTVHGLSVVRLGVNIQMHAKKTWDWTMCSKFVNHVMFKSPHNKGNYMLNKQYILHFNDEQYIHRSYKSYKENDYMHHLDMIIMCSNSVFHIL